LVLRARPYMRVYPGVYLSYVQPADLVRILRIPHIYERRRNSTPAILNEIRDHRFRLTERRVSLNVLVSCPIVSAVHANEFGRATLD